MSGSFDLVGGALREHERVLQRFFHRLKMAHALLEIRNLRVERGALLRFVLERLDDLVEKRVQLDRSEAFLGALKFTRPASWDQRANPRIAKPQPAPRCHSKNETHDHLWS